VPIIFHVKPISSEPEYPTTARAHLAEYPFFPVSVPKFIALSLCTLGLYELYWCFKNWTRIKQRSGENLSPFWRAVFAPCWGIQLFRTVREHAQEQGISTEWSADTLGICYICLALSWRLPDPWSLIASATFLPFLPVLQTVRLVNAKATASEDRNESLSLSNFITLMLGGLVLVLTIVGSFATE
jgi:hypothetical protein